MLTIRTTHIIPSRNNMIPLVVDREKTSCLFSSSPSQSSVIWLLQADVESYEESSEDSCYCSSWSYKLSSSTLPIGMSSSLLYPSPVNSYISSSKLPAGSSSYSIPSPTTGRFSSSCCSLSPLKVSSSNWLSGSDSGSSFGLVSSS